MRSWEGNNTRNIDVMWADEGRIQMIQKMGLTAKGSASHPPLVFLSPWFSSVLKTTLCLLEQCIIVHVSYFVVRALGNSLCKKSFSHGYVNTQGPSVALNCKVPIEKVMLFISWCSQCSWFSVLMHTVPSAMDPGIWNNRRVWGPLSSKLPVE